jgi:hypothetical protein
LRGIVLDNGSDCVVVILHSFFLFVNVVLL